MLAVWRDGSCVTALLMRAAPHFIVPVCAIKAKTGNPSLPWVGYDLQWVAVKSHTRSRHIHTHSHSHIVTVS